MKYIRLIVIVHIVFILIFAGTKIMYSSETKQTKGSQTRENHDHNEDAHADHDHGNHDHGDHDHGSHGAHDHGGHDHGVDGHEQIVELSAEEIKRFGIEVEPAGSGLPVIAAIDRQNTGRRNLDARARGVCRPGGDR